MEDNVTEVIRNLNELKDDSMVPKNVKTKIDGIIGLLSDKQDTSIKVSKAIHEMEEISEDINMHPETRTQIFSVVSMLETVK